MRSGIITAQTIATGKSIRQAISYDSNVDNTPPAGTIIYNIGATTITTRTCSVPSVAVRLTPATGLPLRTFTGTGSTSSAVPVNLRIDCSGVTAKVRMILTDQQNQGNTSNQLGLTMASSASGLAIQILRNGTPVNLGPDSSAIGTTNQFDVFDATDDNSTFTLPLRARYVQTTDNVTAGTANGVATFTMSYQ